MNNSSTNDVLIGVVGASALPPNMLEIEKSWSKIGHAGGALITAFFRDSFFSNWDMSQHISGYYLKNFSL